MEIDVFKDVPEGLYEKHIYLTKKYNETFDLIEDLEQELKEVRIEIAKIKVEDILKKDFTLFYSEFLEDKSSLKTSEKAELLILIYSKILKSVGTELNFLNELSLVLNEEISKNEPVPTDLKDLVKYTSVLDYKYYSNK